MTDLPSGVARVGVPANTYYDMVGGRIIGKKQEKKV